MTDRDERFAALIRTLTSCKQEAEKLGADYLATLISLAVLETALQSERGQSKLADPAQELELLLSAKIRTALSAGNIVAMRPR